jgi:hypothetical protein
MPERTGPGFSLSFGGLLASVMVALKLKEGWDECKCFPFDKNND